MEVLDRWNDASVGQWIGALETAPNLLHVSAGLLKRDAIGQSAEGKVEIAALSIVKVGNTMPAVGTSGNQRSTRCMRKPEIRGHDADHGRWRARQEVNGAP